MKPIKLQKINKPQKDEPFSGRFLLNNHHSNFIGTVNNSKDSHKNLHLTQILETIRKASRNSGTVYEPRDRAVIVDLPEEQDHNQGLNNNVLKMWITEVCNKVISSSFNLLSTDALSYEQTKVACSEGILRNIVLLIEKYSITNQQIKIINEHIQKDIIKYLKRKYPMSESSDVNKALNEAVQSIDNIEALDNDMLQKCDVIFTYREDGNYNSLIMKFLNWIITEIDEKQKNEQKTIYESFEDKMTQIFKKVEKQAWMHEAAMKNKDVRANGQSKIRNQAPSDQANLQYADQVKEYTQYIIGRKISKNDPIYTPEEIEEGHLTIKSPAILRILTKWCKQLWNKFEKKNYFLDREENVHIQEKGREANTMFMWMKIPLNDLVEDEKIKIQHFMAQLQANNFDQQAELFKQELFQEDGFYHIEKIQKVCGKFATKTVKNLHSYIVLYLNRLIHGLLSVSKELYETKLSTKARWTSPPNLVTFKIKDLMRCRFSSKEKEIQYIYKQLQRISNQHIQEQEREKIKDKKKDKDKGTEQTIEKEKDKDTFKIVRVKNRLKLGTNDILINILYKKKFLCEIQLAVKSTQSKFIACSNKFTHYIYELGRTLFGPLTELSSVWMSLDPREKEYQYLIENEKRKSAAAVAIPCAKNNHELVPHARPFICSSCSLSFSHTNYFWDHMKCKADGCRYIICAICRTKKQDKKKLKQILFNKQQKLFNACGDNIINLKDQNDQKIPQYGVCILIESKNIVIERFRKIQHKKIMTIYGLTKKKDEEKVWMIDELINKTSEQRFLKKYIVFEIPPHKGKELIPITIQRAKKDYILPQKVKYIFKKQKDIFSLIEESLTDSDIAKIMKEPEPGMKLIKNMELADNKLTKIQFIIENFPNLERLQLSRNQVSNIDNISKLKSLKKLNLRNNCLTSLPDQICQLHNLKGINIRFNDIKALPNDIGNLKLLDKLESDNNKISDLPKSFKNLQKLNFIDLSNNKLTSFPELIRGFKVLQELYLAKNKLGTIPEWIGQFSNSLITLDLSKTGVSNFPEGIYELKKLQIFKIESMHNTLSAKIGNLQCLKELSIQMPNVEKLPDQIFNLKKLKNLVVEGCKINQLPDCLSEMSNLITFSLINNKLDKISKEITEMKQLQHLKIEGQHISSLPDGFENLINLRSLSLNNNRFVQFPHAILKFSKLFKLQIKTNRLVYIPDNLSESLPELEEIILDENQLKKLPSSLKSAKKLKVLSIDKNNFIQGDHWIKDVYEIIKNNTVYDTTMAKKTPSLGLEELVKSIGKH